MFEFMIKQTHEPEIRFDKAVKFLSSDYYNTPSNFDGSFAATFTYQSTIVKEILKQKKTNVQFFENKTGFYFPGWIDEQIFNGFVEKLISQIHKFFFDRQRSFFFGGIYGKTQ